MLPENRPHPAQLQADASSHDGKLGIECRRCGCRDSYVRDSDRHDGFIIRYRVCRHCGTVRRTKEL